MRGGSGRGVVTSGEGLVISRADLLGVGCGSCIFRLNGQCFHKDVIVSDKDVWCRELAVLKGVFVEDGHVDGVCPEVLDWLFSLGGSSAVVWENYHLFVSRLQASEDYRVFKGLEGEIRLLEESGVSGRDLELLEMKKVAARAWWSRGVDSVLKGLGRVADRESKDRNVDKQVKALGLDALHGIIVGPKKVLEVDKVD